MERIQAWPFAYARGHYLGFQLVIGPDRDAGMLDIELSNLASARVAGEELHIHSILTEGQRHLKAVFKKTYLTKHMVGLGDVTPGTPEPSDERVLDRSGRPSQAIVGLVIDLGVDGCQLEGASSECIEVALSRSLEALRVLWSSTEPVGTVRASAFDLDSDLIFLSAQVSLKAAQAYNPIPAADRFSSPFRTGESISPSRRSVPLRGLVLGVLVTVLVSVGGVAVWRGSEASSPNLDLHTVGQQVCNALLDPDATLGRSTLHSLWQDTERQHQAVVDQYVGQTTSCSVTQVETLSLQLDISTRHGLARLDIFLDDNGKVVNIVTG